MTILVVQVRSKQNGDINDVNINVIIHYHITSFDMKTSLNLRNIARNGTNVEYFHKRMVICCIILYLAGLELEGFNLFIFNKSNKICMYTTRPSGLTFFNLKMVT